MTIYFYLPTIPTQREISKVRSLSMFDQETITITCEMTYINEIKLSIQTNQELYSIDVLTRIQERLKDIFDTCTVFIR